MKRICLLGSTGSIGRQTLDIAAAHRDELRITALAAGSSNIQLLSKQIREFEPEVVCVPTSDAARELELCLDSDGTKKPVIMHGSQSLEQVAAADNSEIVVTGVVGFLGLRPTAAAVKKGKTIALANKETLVAAGSVIMPLAKEFRSSIIPVDSEHSAIFQSIAGEKREALAKIWLTASGGPFRTWTLEQIRNATVSDALKHPNWSMGPKITIDSATLMNKGLEVIEARWLFDMPAETIQVVVHPQSILHSAIEFIDGSIVGQLGVPDMRLPIHYALFYPERKQSQTVPRLNLMKAGALSFEEPDLERFPCLKLAQQVAREANTLPCVLNAANEIVVAKFLDGAIKFIEIAEHIKRVVDSHRAVSNPTLDDIFAADEWARTETNKLLTASKA